jgi:hypothetical protein
LNWRRSEQAFATCSALKRCRFFTAVIASGTGMLAAFTVSPAAV